MIMPNAMQQTISIACHDSAGHMLQYDTGTGRYLVVKRDQTFPKASFSPGSYIVHDKAVIGIVPSVQGPLLLLGDQSYSLVEQNISFELGDAEEGYINTFKVFLDGREIYATEYERPYSDYAALAKPECIDFFSWVNEGFRAPDAIRDYTVPQEQGLAVESKELPLPAMPVPEPEEGRSGQPLRRHAYPWYLQLFAMATFCLWIFSFKPAWSYLPAAIDLTRGEFYLEHGQTGLAIAALSQALTTVPSAKKAKIALAVALFRNKNYSLGLGVLNGIELEGVDWARVKAVLPESYQDQFVEVKRQ
jgi:hypothetical protein